MKKPKRLASVVCAFALSICMGELRAQEISSNELSADIVRVLSRDLFDINSIPYLQPMVEAFNATSNAGFYHTAHVPAQDTFYVRVGVRGMSGFVRDDQRLYSPGIPTGETDNDVASPLAILVANRVKAIFRKGVEEDSIQVPPEAATVLGSLQANFDLNGDYLLREIRKDPVYRQAVLLGLDTAVIDEVILQLPGALALPPGADIDRIMAAVPQIEIGALYGTELLLRYIPPVRFDTTVGTFTFWGLGLKHSVSQYLPESVPLQLAVQFVYQQTSLSNRVGVTAAELEADAVIMNGNVHASYGLDRFTLYGGLALESTAIDARYTYTLPRQVQAHLGLIAPIDLDGDGTITDDEFVPDPENGFPGDTKPQTSHISLDALSAKGTLGAAARIGPVTLALDYGIGSLNVLSIGLMVDVWGM